MIFIHYITLPARLWHKTGGCFFMSSNTHISFSEPAELIRWAKKLDVSPWQLKNAYEETGSAKASVIKKHIEKQKRKAYRQYVVTFEQLG